MSRYLNTNNFLRSVRNFVIDIRQTPQDAQVCGIHWQVAQGTSLENIQFLMSDPSIYPQTTQQVRCQIELVVDNFANRF